MSKNDSMADRPLLPGILHNSYALPKPELDIGLAKAVESNFKAVPMLPRVIKSAVKKKEPTPREESSFDRASDQVLTMLSATKLEESETKTKVEVAEVAANGVTPRLSESARITLRSTTLKSGLRGRSGSARRYEPNDNEESLM